MPMLTFEEYLEADRLLYANSRITEIPSTRRDFAPWPIPPTLARIVGILIVLGIVRAIAQVVGL